MDCKLLFMVVSLRGVPNQAMMQGSITSPNHQYPPKNLSSVNYASLGQLTLQHEKDIVAGVGVRGEGGYIGGREGGGGNWSKEEAMMNLLEMRWVHYLP